MSSQYVFIFISTYFKYLYASVVYRSIFNPIDKVHTINMIKDSELNIDLLE